MNLENQVCSLKLAKKLKEFGVKQQSLWSYKTTEDSDGYENGSLIELTIRLGERHNDTNVYSALTVAELGNIFDWRRQIITLHKVFYEIIVDNPTISEANVRAKMLIYLIENKLINKEDKLDGK